LKCISLDLDGTLLQSDHLTISNENKSAIAACVSAGYHVVINTGRSFLEMQPLVDVLELNLPLMLGNGTEVRDGHGNVIRQVSISPNEIKNLVSLMQMQGRDIDLYNGTECISHSFEERLLDGVDIHKMVVWNVGSKENADRLIAQASACGEYHAFYYSNDGAVEFVSAKAGKGSALLDYIDLHGIKKEHTAAFGDAENDIHHFLVAGHAIVMGNAKPHMHEYGTFITRSNIEHGVAHALKHHLEWI
jgi:HAD superfamily hydrolase (TIGR01484 family)